MKVIDSITKVLTAIEKVLLIVFLAVIVITTFLEVVIRYTPIQLAGIWDEIATFAFVWVTMIGAGACVREGSHMTMDFVISFFPKSASKYLAILNDLCASAVGIGILYAAKKLIPRTRRSGMLSAALQLPIWIQNSALAVGAALMLFWAIINLIKDIYAIVQYFKNKKVAVNDSTQEG